VSMFEVEGLARLEADLAGAARHVQVGASRVVAKGAQNIKDDAAQRVSGLRHAPALPAALSYDVKWGGGAVEAEIGFDKGRPQGALGNLIEYGSANNPPHAPLGKALEAEAPRFAQAIDELAGEALS